MADRKMEQLVAARAARAKIRSKSTSPVKVPATAPVAKPVGAVTNTHHECQHNYCCVRGRGLRNIPVEGRRSVCEAIDNPNAQHQVCPRICPAHLIDSAGAVTKSNIHRIAEDPVLLGIVSGRNKVGDEWCQLHVVAAGAASNRGTKRAASAADDGALIAEINSLKKKLRAAVTRAQKVDVKPSEPQAPHFSYRWLIDPLQRNRAMTMTGLTLNQLLGWVTMLEACDAEHYYDVLAPNGAARVVGFHDALALAAIRVFTIRSNQVAEQITGHDPQYSGKCILAVVYVVAEIDRTTWGRRRDNEAVEKDRVNILKDDEFIDVTHALDGFKARMQYPSDPDLHRSMHSSYLKISAAQVTVMINQAFELDRTTGAYAGSYGETRCCIDSDDKRVRYPGEPTIDNPWKTEALHSVFSGLLKGKIVMTDKGYDLAAYLSEKYEAYHMKPTEHSNSGTQGMTEGEGARSTRMARPRAATERMVWRFKNFDYLGGSGIMMSEWA